jgi:hypothetical protein
MLSKSTPAKPTPGVRRIMRGGRVRAAALHPLSLAFGLLLANVTLFGATFSLPNEPAGEKTAPAAQARVAGADTDTSCAQCAAQP